MSNRLLSIILLVCISTLFGYALGTHKIETDWKNYSPQVRITSKEPPVGMENVNFSLFWNVMRRVEQSYYDKKAIDSQKLLNGAISGMVQSLGDPYTVYLPPIQNDDFKDGLAGKFEGIGAELGIKEKQIIVVSPLDGSPAIRSGIKPGDAILKVEGQPTDGWTLAQAVQKIRGPKGTKVALTIYHKGAKEPQDITITRDTINVKSVTSWVKPAKDVERVNLSKLSASQKQQKIVYVRLSQFGDETNQEWTNAINILVPQVQRGDVKGFILDLRNNPGGYLTDATFIAAEFLPKGKTVVVQDKGNGEKTELPTQRAGQLQDIPVIVLINKGSASASEIVAGALRDYNRAKLLGETSFGKGTIQQAEDLGNGAGLHVTIAKWLTPNGTWVHEKGIKPDIEVGPDEKDQAHDIQLEKAIEELVK